MINQLFNLTKGNWKVQKTIYNLKTNQINNFNYSLTLQNFINKKNKYYISYDNSLEKVYINNSYNKNDSNISKTCNTNKNIYKIKNKNQKYIKLIHENKRIFFEEVIHIMNEKFFLVTATIKKNQKYLIISFTSYIKII